MLSVRIDRPAAKRLAAGRAIFPVLTHPSRPNARPSISSNCTEYDKQKYKTPTEFCKRRIDEPPAPIANDSCWHRGGPRSPCCAKRHTHRHVFPTPLLSFHILRRLPTDARFSLQRELLGAATQQTHHSGVNLGPTNINRNTSLDIIDCSSGCSLTGNLPAITGRGRPEPTTAALTAAPSPPPPSPQRRYPDTTTARASRQQPWSEARQR